MADFNYFQKIADALPQAVADANTTLGAQAQAHIQQHIIDNGQVDTGYMLNSVHTEPQDDGSVNVVVGAEYGVYQNYGTRYLPPRPFFEPGLEDTIPDIEAAFQAIVDAMAGAAGL